MQTRLTTAILSVCMLVPCNTCGTIVLLVLICVAMKALTCLLHALGLILYCGSHCWHAQAGHMQLNQSC